jgi:hypothetical protein
MFTKVYEDRGARFFTAQVTWIDPFYAFDHARGGSGNGQMKSLQRFLYAEDISGSDGWGFWFKENLKVY